MTHEPVTKGLRMKKITLMCLALLAVIGMSVPSAVLADSNANAIAVFNQSPAVRPFFDSSYGYAVFPTVGKGGFIIGAAYGKGKVYHGGYATGTASITKLTVGFQAGGQVFSEIIFFEDKRAYDEFTSGSFEFDTNASAVAVTAGAQAQAGSMGASAGASAGPATGAQADIHYYKGMAIFVHAKGGLMLEASVGGQRFDFEPY
jgi:lipid-binding SYLF domain-containing protein